MTCWVKLPTPALPGSGSRRPETAVCFDLSRGCPSAPLFLCPNLLYTPTADCQAFQILSTRFPPGFTRFLQCSIICTGYTVTVLKKHPDRSDRYPDRSDRYEEKAYSLRGCKILKPSPVGEGGPAGPDEGKACHNRPQTDCSRKLRPHQSPSVTASPEGEASGFIKCSTTIRCASGVNSSTEYGVPRALTLSSLRRPASTPAGVGT